MQRVLLFLTKRVIVRTHTNYVTVDSCWSAGRKEIYCASAFGVHKKKRVPWHLTNPFASSILVPFFYVQKKQTTATERHCPKGCCGGCVFFPSPPAICTCQSRVREKENQLLPDSSRPPDSVQRGARRAFRVKVSRVSCRACA